MRKLCWVCGAFSGGVALGVLVLPPSWQLWAAGGAALCACAGALLCGRARGRVAACALAAALGLCCCALQQRLVIDRAETLAGETRVIAARVTDYPAGGESGVSVYVRLTGELRGVKCRLSGSEAVLGALCPGDEITVEAALSSARYRYGEETESANARGVFLRAYATEELALTGRWSYRWLYLPKALCRAVQTQLAALFPGDTAAFQTALLTGDKSGLYEDYELYYTLSRAGLMHVAAVSGMHVAFLVSFAVLLFPNRRRAGVVLLPFLLAFAALTGFTPSVCRAVFMQLCLLGAPLAGRESDPPTSMALILAVLLLLNPCAAASVSLQLSFAATAGILCFGQRIYARLSRSAQGWGAWLWRAAAASAASSASALVFTLPLMAVHFGSVSVVAPLSNVLCLWCISLLFAGGYLAAGLGALLPAAGRVLAWLLSWGDRYVFAVARLLTRLPCAAVYTVNGLYAAWLVWVYALFLLAWLWRDREKGMRLLAPLCLSLITLWGCALGQMLLRSRALRVTALDVGQGACTLLESGREAVMVDCGGGNTLDYPGQTPAYYALSRQRTRLDALILTHLHRDHAGGVPRLLALLEVETLYLPETLPEQAALLPAILEAAAQNGTQVVYVREDLELFGARLRLRITAPRGEGTDREDGLFICASQGDFDVLITGDAGAAAERSYLRREKRDIELLLVGHHGSAGSTDERFLRGMKPEMAVISVGYNDYGHPRPETLARLAAEGIEIHRTDREGNITVTGGEE